MTNNSDGLSPTLRPQLGVGWNRALPAPFGFDNGVQGDGVNDYLRVDSLIGLTVPNKITIEFWAYSENTIRNGFFTLSFNGLDTETIGAGLQSNFVNDFYVKGDGVLAGTNPGYNSQTKNHFVYVLDFIAKVVVLYCNNIAVTSLNWGAGTTYTTFNKIRLLSITDSNINNPFTFSKTKKTHFRLYNRALTTTEIALNYNNGVGENPCVTENLLFWYKFDQFETLDFSALQDGSDMRLGIRDLSNNNRHAQPINMDTNPASPTYVIKPF